MNIKDLILEKDNDSLSIIGVTAMQLGLINLLKALEVQPDYLMGHSVGEIACAYCDDCLTMEEAILCSYEISQAKTGKELVNRLRMVVSPKKRSKRWLRTTNNKEIECFAEYLARSLISPFVLNKTMPRDTVVIEIAPHASLRGALQKSLGCDLFTIPLIDNGYLCPIKVLTKTVGELYLLGCNPRTECLYPDVGFPVSRGTPMISPLIKWNHRFKWHVLKQDVNGTVTSVKDFISTKKTRGNFVIYSAVDEWSFITGHNIDGKMKQPQIIWGRVL